MIRLVVPLIMILTLPGLKAADWPQWRGPDGIGVSPEQTAPLLWSKTQNGAHL